MDEERYGYVDLDGLHLITRSEILKEYFDYWSEQMKKIGKENQISEDKCVDDWITVNWAYRVPNKVK